MKAAKLIDLTKYSLTATFLSASIGITCGALHAYADGNPQPATLDSLVPGATGANPGASVYGQTQEVNPQLQAAAERVTKARSDLDIARQRLNASKANLKAADAEYKAAKADQTALTLRTQAQKLADSSGLNEGTSTATPGAAAVGAGFAPPVSSSVSPVPVQPVVNSPSADQPFDFSGASSPAPGK